MLTQIYIAIWRRYDIVGLKFLTHDWHFALFCSFIISFKISE